MNNFTIIGAGFSAGLISQGLIDLGYNVCVLAKVDIDSGYSYSDLYESTSVERTHKIGGNTLKWHAGLIYPDMRWMSRNGLSLDEFSKLLFEGSRICSIVFNNPNFINLPSARPINSRIYYIKGPRVSIFHRSINIINFKEISRIDLKSKTITFDDGRCVDYENLIVATDAIGAAEIYSRFLNKCHSFNILDHPLVYLGEIETTKRVFANLNRSDNLSDRRSHAAKRGLVLTAMGVRHMVYLRPKGCSLLHSTMESNLPRWRKYLRILTNLDVFRAAIYLKWGLEFPSRRFEAFLVMQMPVYAKLDTSKRTIRYGDKIFYDELCSLIASKLSLFKFIKNFAIYSNFIYFPGNHFTSTLTDVDVKKYESKYSIYFVGSSVIDGNSYTNSGVQIMVATANFLSRFVR